MSTKIWGTQQVKQVNQAQKDKIYREKHDTSKHYSGKVLSYDNQLQRKEGKTQGREKELNTQVQDSRNIYRKTHTNRMMRCK